MTPFPCQRRFKTQHHKHGLSVAVGLNLQLQHQGESTAFPRCSLPATWELQQYHFKHKMRPEVSWVRISAKQHAHLPSDEEQGWKGSVTNTLNYLPSPSLETQQACPKSTYQLNSTKLCVYLCISDLLTLWGASHSNSLESRERNSDF